jgi:hypothetical protein
MGDSKKVLELIGSGLVPHLVGPRGEGKTTYVKDLAKLLNKELTILNLSAIEATDFCGLPFIENNLTKYARPQFLNSDFLFLDEIDRVRDSSVKSSLLSLLVDRKIQGHELKENCIIISAGNGQVEGYDTTDFDIALEDRLLIKDFTYSISEKLGYLNAKYPHNTFIKFLEIKPEILSEFSGRRIEAFLKVNNVQCEIFFNKEVARMYKHFIEETMVTLDDIKKGVYDFNILSTISKSSLVIDIVNDFYRLDTKDAKNINKFINLLRAEEKSSYFTKLKKLCLENPENFTEKSNELNEAGLFKGQKDFLTELTK